MNSELKRCAMILFVFPFAAAHAAPPKDACSLLTPAPLSAILGIPVGSEDRCPEQIPACASGALPSSSLQGRRRESCSRFKTH